MTKKTKLIYHGLDNYFENKSHAPPSHDQLGCTVYNNIGRHTIMFMIS